MDTEPKTYDLVVIGSGPAGEKGAAQAAYFGKSVALIEREPAVGGAGANTGTLPSKTLRETALFLSGFRNRDLSGVHLSLKHDVTIRDFMAHEQHVTANERVRILKNLARAQSRPGLRQRRIRRRAHDRRHQERRHAHAAAGRDDPHRRRLVAASAADLSLRRPARLRLGRDPQRSPKSPKTCLSSAAA